MKETTDAVLETLIKKNADYGSSFGNSYRKYGDLSTVIRLTDKLNRLEVLGVHKNTPLVDESIFDTYLDIAGYAILAYVERRLMMQEMKEAETQPLEGGM